MKKILAAAAAATMLVGTTASATSAQSLSLKNAPRAATVVGESNEQLGAAAWVLGAIGLGLVVWGIVELTSDDSDSN
ncbi:hypothetical protein [Sphingomonas turrisvirgatae]|uniref:Uncharacterized protein n=1 Tax=Sphingomonas turrisvirgatae TaxID=1888892 RepID=A0A1E3LV05_9SPHN|nr:hypothetical protein [Sphingomonas turrisvirgatae]ODP36660.1 hypothetical protein BFL28_04970 [Sphingomonas turrisvirgatae]